jgi:transposase InsO family protein
MKRSRYTEQQVVFILKQAEMGTSVEDARRKIDAWRIDYNESRPHSALGWKTPAEFAHQARNSVGLVPTKNTDFSTLR